MPSLAEARSRLAGFLGANMMHGSKPGQGATLGLIGHQAWHSFEISLVFDFSTLFTPLV